MNDTREEGTETGDAVTWGVRGARRKEAEGREDITKGCMKPEEGCK